MQINLHFTAHSKETKTTVIINTGSKATITLLKATSQNHKHTSGVLDLLTRLQICQCT